MRKSKKVSDDEVMMIWCAYRYAIGRHTYVCDLSDYIALNYYDKLDDDTKRDLSKDIRTSICECLSFNNPSLMYEHTISYDDRLGIPDLMEYLNTNNISEEELLKIEEIEVYKEGWSNEYPKKFAVKYRNPIRDKHISDLNVSDLLCWEKLASYFDVDNYKLVHINFNGKKSEEICFVGWVPSFEPYEGSDIKFKRVGFKWEKKYYQVNNYNGGYLADEYIESVEDYKKQDND